MNFALSIIFMWVGAALLVVAFHPLHTQDYTQDGAGHVMAGTTLVKSIKSGIAMQGSAYDTV